MPPIYEQPRLEDEAPSIQVRTPTVYSEWGACLEFPSLCAGIFTIDEWQQLFGFGQGYIAQFEDIPEPATDVTITIEVNAPLGLLNEYIQLSIRPIGVIVDKMFESDGFNCRGRDIPSRFTFSVTASEFDGWRTQALESSRFMTLQLNHSREFDNEIFCGDEPAMARIRIEFTYLSEETEELDLKLWGEDLCQNVVFAPAATNEFFFQPQTTHTNRIVAQRPTAIEEVCKHHRGQLVIDQDGFARVLYCSKPSSGIAPEDQINHLAEAYIIQPENEVLANQVPVGFGCFLGSYHAPRWSEVELWSRQFRCGQPV